MLPFEVIPIIDIPGLGDRAAQVGACIYMCVTTFQVLGGCVCVLSECVLSFSSSPFASVAIRLQDVHMTP